MTQRRSGQLVGSIAFSIVLLGLITLAIGGSEPAIATWSLAFVVALAIEFHFLLPGSVFLTVVFANSIGIYACVYLFFVDVSFPNAGVIDSQIGFVLPLVAFAVAVAVNHRDIQSLIERSQGSIDPDLRRAFVWIAPLAAIGGSTFVVPISSWDAAAQGYALLVYMAMIAVLAATASRAITLFVLDLGILFEDFSANAAKLIKPAVAFFTWYSLLTIVFGCLFAIVDRYSAQPGFVIGGEVRPISFAEGLYVSVVTLSTVGYGDIVARGPVMRVLVGIEIFMGVMLILFGAQAILSTTPRKRGE